MRMLLTDILTVRCDTHVKASKLMATVCWTYQNDQMTVDIWEIHIRNLTRELNGYNYSKRMFECNGGAFHNDIAVLFKLFCGIKNNKK